MNKLIFSILIYSLSTFLYSTNLSSQNLIPNGSFEEFTECPGFLSDFHVIESWSNPSNTATPDYFNACNQDECSVGVPNNSIGDNVPAQTGDAYIGLFVGIIDPDGSNPDSILISKEYLMTELSEALIAGQEYTFKLWTRRAPLVYLGSFLQVHISSQPLQNEEWENIDVSANLLQTEAVTSDDWIEYSVDYISDGTEKYITIGNFQTTIDLWDTMKPSDTTPQPVCFFLGYEDRVIYHIIDEVSFEKKTETSIQSKQLNEFSISPNPIVNNQLVISGPQKTNTSINLEILNQNGRIVLDIPDFRLGTTIDVSEIEDKGVYYARITRSHQSEIIKILIL